MSPIFVHVLEKAGVEVHIVLSESDPRSSDVEYDALYVRAPRRVTGAVMDAFPLLHVIAVPGVGAENVDVAAATDRRIAVINGAGMAGRAVVEWTVGAILWLSREMGSMHAAVLAGEWGRRLDIEGKHDVASQTVGVIGFGQIGQQVAHIMAQTFGARVIVSDIVAKRRAAAAECGFAVKDLSELLPKCDVVSLHTSAHYGGGPVLDRERLSLLRSGASVVNSARGGLLDCMALLRMLKEDRLAGAAVDVFDPEPPDSALVAELAGYPNVLLGPHAAGMTVDSVEALAEGVGESLVAVLRGEKVPNCLNPEVWN